MTSLSEYDRPAATGATDVADTRCPSIAAGIGDVLRRLASQTVGTLEALIETVHTLFSGDRETRRRVAFSVAMIALSAKMAKADGVVAPSEVAAFQRIFAIPPAELRNVFRLYDLAKHDTAGFEAYALRMTTLCSDGEQHCRLLSDVLDGLFHIAAADGLLHGRERQFLLRIAEIFQLPDAEFAAMENRHVAHGETGDYAILGVEPGTPLPQIRERYLQLVRDNHPDRLAARGVPEEFMAIGVERMKAINAAYDKVARAKAA